MKTMMVPKIGSYVEVVVDNSFANSIMLPEAKHREPPLRRISGTVIASPRRMEDYLTILNLNNKVTNCIARNLIVSINDTPVDKVPVTADKVFTVKNYTIRQDGISKRWSCSCIGFQYRKHCKHVEQCQKEEI
jgi:hypothetical protein